MPIYALDGLAPELPADGSAWIAPNAQLIGKIRLGVQSSVWFGAVLRGDNELISLGDRSNIQENCVLHTDIGSPLTIEENCTIGHSVTLHGCTIGRGSLIGMGAIILNGAVIGENCIVGAHALVTEGKIFPANSMIVGSPAAVKRTLPPEAAAQLRQSALHYVKNAQRFAKGLTSID
jgi:carbonic anhydrase/acetyltransferase-like protein (isoleucine patch superfamily)